MRRRFAFVLAATTLACSSTSASSAASTSSGPASSSTGSASTSSAASTTSGATGASTGGITATATTGVSGTTSGASSTASATGSSTSSTSTSSGGPSDAGSFTVTLQFDGDMGMGLAGCPGTPPRCRQIPEANAAANGAQVVQATWQNVNVYDYSGTLLHSTPLPAFIQAAGLSSSADGGFPIEPHVLFDEFIQRWILTSSCLYDCLLVSSSSDAMSSWQGIYVSNQGNDPGMHLGYDSNGVYVADYAPADADPNTAGISYDFFAIPSAEVQWTTTFAPTHLNRGHNHALDGQPIIDHDLNKDAGSAAFFMAKSCGGGSCQNSTNFAFDWLVNEVTWSGTTATFGPDQLIQTNVGSTASQWLHNTPLDTPQLGSTTPVRTAESHRVMDVIQTGTHLNAVMGSGPCDAGCGAQGGDANDLLFWVELDCTNPSACVVSQTAKLSSSTEGYVWPSVGVDSNGNVGIATAAIGASIDPSILGFGRQAADPANTLFGPTTVIAGTQPYTCINNPVGYATAVGITTVRDPVDETKLWTTMQYGESATACVWNTRIFQYQIQ